MKVAFSVRALEGLCVQGRSFSPGAVVQQGVPEGSKLRGVSFRDGLLSPIVTFDWEPPEGVADSDEPVMVLHRMEDRDACSR